MSLFDAKQKIDNYKENSSELMFFKKRKIMPLY